MESGRHTGIDRTGLVSSPPVLFEGHACQARADGAIALARPPTCTAAVAPGIALPGCLVRDLVPSCISQKRKSRRCQRGSPEYGQRGWKRQPEGGSSALGTSPVMVSFSCLSSGCDGKAAVNRVCV